MEYLIGEFGPSRMTALLSEFNSGKNPSAAIGMAYGFELGSLDAAWTAGKFGGDVPALVPVILDFPDDLAGIVDEPESGPQITVSPVAAAELLFQTPIENPSAWNDFGGWPIIFFGAGGIAAIAYFGLRTLKRRGF